MNYVKCINNRAYIQFGDQPIDDTDTTDLTIGQVYKALPQTEDDRRLDELRVYDDTGEDYLFPSSYFEPYNGTDDAEIDEPVQLAKVDNPWIRNAGIFADDPTWDDFLQHMADYRQQLDEEEAAETV